MTACLKDKALSTLPQVKGTFKEVASKPFQNSLLAVDGRIENPGKRCKSMSVKPRRCSVSKSY
jgi:hypothetical protein